MKKLIGFILFWIAIGMLLMLLIKNIWIGILLIILLMIIGYNLFDCGC